MANSNIVVYFVKTS